MIFEMNPRAKELKVAYIGGGSRGWAWGFMMDLAMDEAMCGTVRLYDIDRPAAERNKIIGNKISAHPDAVSRWEYEVSDSLQDALTGADFVVISILPGTFEEMRSDVHLPERVGVYQPVGDTVGAGGFMRAMRTIPMYVTFAEAIREAQMIFIPGGFSGGDEPDGSGKFITAFFRSAAIKEGVTDLLDCRDGLMLGICNGFQALIKLGLVPYGRIIDTDESCPTLTFNAIGRHQSRIVHTRVASNKSPWLRLTRPGEVYSVPISHGEGRFYADEALIKKLAENGQIATQYVDLAGCATGDVRFNPNGSMAAIEGITSPDGRVLGKMGHSERWNSGLYKNVPGNYDIRIFEAGVKYFK